MTGGKKKDRNDPMFAPTRVEVDKLNKECQQLRLKNRELKTWETLHINGQKFHINDRILFERTADQFGVNNGDLGTITGFNSKRKLFSAELDDGRKVLIRADKYQDVSLGYAMTAHKGQGTTVEQYFCSARWNSSGSTFSLCAVESSPRGDSGLCGSLRGR
jgi:ATP-dependent exoDNAse (exonuclease V) alpha subunit